jgi:transcriptional regulator with XRE-family HTH domain
MNKVKELCVRRGITQKQLAYSVGVSQPTVSDWFNNKTDPSGKRLEKLSEILGVSRAVIMGYDADPEALQSLRGFKVDKLFDEKDFGFKVIEDTSASMAQHGPETQAIAAEVLCEALNHGVTKEEALAFIKNYAQLMPQERKTIMSNMMFLRSQHNEEGET